jgi:hypothetical protein
MFARTPAEKYAHPQPLLRGHGTLVSDFQAPPAPFTSSQNLFAEA